MLDKIKEVFESIILSMQNCISIFLISILFGMGFMLGCITVICLL